MTSLMMAVRGSYDGTGAAGAVTMKHWTQPLTRPGGLAGTHCTARLRAYQVDQELVNTIMYAWSEARLVASAT